MARRGTDGDEPDYVDESDWRQPLIVGAVLAVVTVVLFGLILRKPRLMLYAIPGLLIAIGIGGMANKAATAQLPRWGAPAIVVSLWLPLTMPLLAASFLEP